MQKLMSIIAICILSSTVLAKPAATANPDILITSNLKLTAQTKTDANKESNYTITNHYPLLTGSTLTTSANQFNEKIQSMIENANSEFTMQIVKGGENAPKLPDGVNHNTLATYYEASLVKPNNHPIISVRLDEEAYFAGAAHPTHTHEVLNYDLTTGKTLELNDLFKANSNYLEKLSAFSAKVINRKIKDSFKKGYEPTVENYKLWNLAPQGLVITFPEYQVAPYFYGPVKVFIPYKALRSIVATDSPISVCVKNNKC